MLCVPMLRFCSGSAAPASASHEQRHHGQILSCLFFLGVAAVYFFFPPRKDLVFRRNQLKSEAVPERVLVG